MRGRRRFGVLGASLLFGLTIASAGIASAAGPARTAHERTIAYWTPARIANATPRDVVRAGDRFVPNARPQPPSGGTVTGASWTKGGQILVKSGKVVFTLDSGDYICSGSVVNDAANNGVSVVLTAGHCAYDWATQGGFARSWMFIPNFDGAPTYSCGSTIYGCWTARALVVDSGFSGAGSFSDRAVRHDWAFAVVGDGGKANASLESVVGTFPISFTTAGSPAYAFGYPAAGKYHGSDLTYCSGPVFNDSLNNNETLGMACGMTGGSSGGPWLTSFSESTGAGTLNGLNSYGYNGIKNMYGPKFNGNTSATFTRANQGPTTNQVVTVQP